MKHMKLLRALAVALLLTALIPFSATSQCTNSFPYLTVAAPTSGTTTISSCTYPEEYNTITGLVAGATYQVSSTVASDYLTVRQGTAGGPVVNSGTTPVTFTATASGTHYLHVNLNAACATGTGCRGTSITFIPPPCAGTPTAGSITGSSAVCTGSGTTLTLSGVPVATGLSYQWKSSTTPGGPYSNMGTATTQATGSLTAPMYYVVTVTCSNSGLSATTSEFAVAITPTPIVSVTPSLSSICTPVTGTTLTASGATTYTWGPSSGLSGTSGASVTATPTATATYTVTGTTSGCTGTATAVINVSTTPTPTVTATPASVCTGANSQLQATVPATLSAVNKYGFSTSTGGSLDPMTGATQVISTGNDDTPTAAPASIGFTFNFNGTNYTQYSVSPDGWIRLGGTAATSEYTNSITSTTNAPRIAAYWDDLHTGTTGNVKVLVTGTAPNRIFKVQWFVEVPRTTTGPANSTFQAWLYEGTNVIEFRYGAMGPQTAGSASAGLTGSATNYESVTFSTNTMSAISANDLNSGVPASGRMYTFTPPTVTYSWAPATFLSSTTIANPIASGVTATTTYTVTATNGSCTGTGTVTVTSVNPPATATATNSTQCGVGVPSASVSGAGGTETYLWYAASTGGTPIQTGGSTYTSTISVTTTFYVAISNGVCDGPRTPVTATVNVSDALTASASATTVCPNTTITLSSVKAAGPNVYSYSWSATPSANSGLAGTPTTSGITVTPTAPGTYTYTITGVDGTCTAQASVIVTVSSLPTIFSATATPSVVCSGNTVSLLALTPTGSGATSATVGTQNTTDITGGPYREGACAGNKAQYLFTSAELAAAGITAGNITSLAFNVTSIGSGGVMGNYTIRMASTTATSLTTTFDNTTGTIVYGPVGYTTVSGINTHTFATPFFWDGASNVVVTICHDNLCTGSSTVAFQNIANRVVYDYSGATSSCSSLTGASSGIRPVITFSYSPYSAGTYTWSWDPGALSGNSVSVSPVNNTSSPVVNTYTVTAVDPATTCSNTATVNVTVNPLPAVTATSAAAAICTGSSTTLTAGGADTYVWTPGSGLSSATGSSVSANPTGTATYTVTGTDVNGCVNTASVMLTVNALPTVTLSTISPVCVDASAFTLSGESPAGGSFSGTGVNSGMFEPATAGVGSHTVTYTFTDGNGCANTANTSVTVNGLPAVTATAASSAICEGVSSSITAGGADTYTWTPGSTLDATSGAMVTATPAATTTYSVTGTDGNGCVNTASVMITVNPLPVVTLSSISAVCVDASSFTLSGEAPAGGTFSGTGVNAGMFEPATAGAGSHTVTYTYVDGNGCSNSTNTAVIVNSLPVITATSASSAICEGGSTTITAAGADTYVWTPGSTLDATSGAIVTATPSATTIYSVTGTDANGCVNTESVVITVNPLPVVTLAPMSALCENESAVVLTGESPAGGSFSGSNVSGGMFDAVTAGAGTHTVTYTYVDGNGCSNSANNTVTVNAAPVVDLGSDVILCPGQVATLTAPSGMDTYLWSTGETTETITVSAAGTYSVSVGMNGCDSTDDVTVTVDLCTGIEANTNAFEVTVSPNPSTGTFNLVVNGMEITRMNVEIRDVQGKVVYSFTDTKGAGAFTKEIDLGSLSKGIYYLRMNTENSISTKKLVIQ